MQRIDLIINRIRMDMVKRGDMLKVEDVNEILSLPLIGVVPDDEQIVVSTNQGEPLVGSSSMAGQAYMNVCKRLLGEEVPFLNLDAKRGMMSKLKDMFKKINGFIPEKKFRRGSKGSFKTFTGLRQSQLLP